MAFCSNCGQAISDQAISCPQCGHPGPGRVVVAAPKDKTVAVLLAVFLSFWTWLYTYQRDATKFWVGLGVSIVSIPLTLVFIGFLGGIGIWIWAIVDVAVKPPEFYSSYPRA